jgi:1,4-dihydroxy-2-naphthoate octaprenyltransferase
MIKDYLVEMLEPTILYGFFAGLAGVAAAYHFGNVHLGFAALAVLASVLAQMGVNLIDDYVDFKSGLDKETQATRFSGGSKLVADGIIDARVVLSIGLAAALIAGAIGTYFVFMQLWLLPLIVFGTACVFLYAKYMTRVPFLADPAAALCFIAISVGCFAIASGSFANVYLALLALAPVGMEVAGAVTVNSVPDRDADRKHRRKNAMSILWDYNKMAKYYLLLQIVAFSILLYGIVTGAVSYVFLIAFVLIIPYLYVAKGISGYKNPDSFERYMAVQVVASFAFYLLVIAIYLV